MATYSRTQGHNLPNIPTISYDTDVFDNRHALNLPDIPTISYDTDIFDNRHSLVLPIIPQILAYSQLGTALTVDKAFLYDDSVGYTDYTTEANQDTANDVPLLPASVGAGDGFFIGKSQLFQRLVIHMGTAGAGTYTFQPKYWNGSAYTNLTVLYNSITNCKYTNSLSMAWELPSNWAQNTVNSSQQYWLFLSYVSGTMTTRPLADRIWVGMLAQRTPIAVWVYNGASWILVNYIWVYDGANWGMKTVKFYNGAVWL
jgi:hypothetical protein